MALQLEADHAPEVRAGDHRQLDGLRDHRAPGEANLALAGRERLPRGADGGWRPRASSSAGTLKAVRRRFEPKRLPERHDVDLTVSERETDDVAHRSVSPERPSARGCRGLTIPPLARPPD